MDGEAISSGDGAGLTARAARRSSLMLRAAKLLCDSGEYVCIVRDVSAGGVKLRLFHQPPPEKHLFLETANEDRYAMERVWVRDDHAGFRFSCAIDVDRFIEEPGDLPRRPVRIRLQAEATVHADNLDSRAVLIDLSQHGACIDAGRKLALQQRVRLQVPGLPPRVGFVRWRRGFTHGLVFQESLRLDELAQQAFALQPYAECESLIDERPALARTA